MTGCSHLERVIRGLFWFSWSKWFDWRIYFFYFCSDSCTVFIHNNKPCVVMGMHLENPWAPMLLPFSLLPSWAAYKLITFPFVTNHSLSCHPNHSLLILVWNSGLQERGERKILIPNLFVWRQLILSLREGMEVEVSTWYQGFPGLGSIVANSGLSCSSHVPYVLILLLMLILMLFFY